MRRFLISPQAQRIIRCSLRCRGAAGDTGGKEWEFDDDWLDDITQRDVGRSKKSRFGRALKQGSARKRRMQALEEKLDGVGPQAASEEPFCRIGTARVKADRIDAVRAHFHASVVPAYAEGIPNGFVRALLLVERDDDSRANTSFMEAVRLGSTGDGGGAPREVGAESEALGNDELTIRSITLWSDETAMERGNVFIFHYKYITGFFTILMLLNGYYYFTAAATPAYAAAMQHFGGMLAGVPSTQSFDWLQCEDVEAE